MLGKLFSKLTSTSHFKAHLAEFQLDTGVTVPDWERLTDLKVKRDAEIDGAPHDVWELTFEKHAFILFFYTGEHGWGGEPFSQLRLKATFVKTPQTPDFQPADDRFWFRQIDQIRGTILPKLNVKYPGNLG